MRTESSLEIENPDRSPLRDLRRAPRGRRVVRTGEEGNALLVSLGIVALCSLLGLAFAMMARDESRIAVNHLRQTQADYAARGVLRCVRAWFEDPDPAGGFMVPPVAILDRSLRLVDPTGSGSFQPYATAPPPWNVTYREGTDDPFGRPYRGSPALALLGSEDGPDVLIAASAGGAAAAWLDALSDTLFPGFPSAVERVRVESIALHAPPLRVQSGQMVRSGVATIDVNVSVRLHEGTAVARQVALAALRGVLADPPYVALGTAALFAGGVIDLRSGLETRWGTAAARGDVLVPDAASPASPSGWPRLAAGQVLVPDTDGDGTDDDTDGDGRADWLEWWSDVDDTMEDPWFFAVAGGAILPAVPAAGPDDLPWPFDAAQVPAGSSGPWEPDTDRSNLMQAASIDPVPGDGRSFWRMASLSGARDHHYFRYDPAAGGWREDGTGAVTDVQAATAGRTGLFFFDTRDGLDPHDDDGDGTPDNLSPPVLLGPGWWSGGVLYLGAASVEMTGLVGSGRTIPVAPPGEPCADLDADGVCSASEPFIRLGYPPDPLFPGAAFARVAFDWPTSGGTRLVTGPSRDTPIAFEGVLIVAGDLRPGGDANILGTVLAGGSARPDPAGGVSTTGTLRVLAAPGTGSGTGPPSRSGAPRTAFVAIDTDIAAMPPSYP